MIRFRFDAEDMGRVRFAFLPLWEVTASIRVLSNGGSSRLHLPWRERVIPELGSLDVDLLTALVPRAGYVPDFLTPSAAGQTVSVEAQLAQVARTPLVEVVEQLTVLWHGHRTEQRAGQVRAGLVRDLMADPGTALLRIVEELRRYHEVAVGPYLTRIRALWQADLAHRLEQLAGGGVQELLRTLHPSVTFEQHTLKVVKYYDEDIDLRHRGLVLVPCAFAWPDVYVNTHELQDPTVTYSPRGVGRLWEAQPPAPRSPLAVVLGRTRALLLTQLDLPMSTTQLAALLQMSPPTLSTHLQALHGAGIVSRRRDGHAVLYRRTDLGEHLMTGRDR